MKRYLLLGAILSSDAPQRPISEVNGVIRFHGNVIGAAQSLALVTVSQYGAVAIFLEPLNRTVAGGIHNKAALPINRQPVRSVKFRSARVFSAHFGWVLVA